MDISKHNKKEPAMNSTLIFYVGLAVFILMAIGLGLTVYEFKTHVIQNGNKQKKNTPNEQQ